MDTLKIHKVGNSLVATFSEELIKKFNLAEGHTLKVFETDDGVCLTPCDSELDSVMKAFEVTRKKYHHALQKLAQ